MANEVTDEVEGLFKEEFLLFSIVNEDVDDEKAVKELLADEVAD